MTVFYWDKAFAKYNDSVFNFIQGKYFDKIIKYMIDSKYRKIVALKSWLAEQINNPAGIVIAAVQDIKTFSDPDVQELEILRWVRKNLKYTDEMKAWDMIEKWQTAEETLLRMTGDCEDGAILLYVLSVLKGVPENRLLIKAGNVWDPYRNEECGHCWLSYRAQEYPLNFTYLDWCYYYDNRHPATRNQFYVKDKIIYEYSRYMNDKLKFLRIEHSNYHNLWFAFNHKVSFTDLKQKSM